MTAFDCEQFSTSKHTPSDNISAGASQSQPNGKPPIPQAQGLPRDDRNASTAPLHDILFVPSHFGGPNIITVQNSGNFVNSQIVNSFNQNSGDSGRKRSNPSPDLEDDGLVSDGVSSNDGEMEDSNIGAPTTGPSFSATNTNNAPHSDTINDPGSSSASSTTTRRASSQSPANFLGIGLNVGSIPSTQGFYVDLITGQMSWRAPTSAYPQSVQPPFLSYSYGVNPGDTESPPAPSTSGYPQSVQPPFFLYSYGANPGDTESPPAPVIHNINSGNTTTTNYNEWSTDAVDSRMGRKMSRQNGKKSKTTKEEA